MSLQPATTSPTPPAERPALNGPTTPERPSRLPRSEARPARRWLAYAAAVLGLVVVLVFGAQALGLVRLWGDAKREDLVLHKVQAERIQLTITERGTLESAENSDIVCRVKARSANSTVASTIRYLFVEDGQFVRRGEKLVQLDDSGLYEQLKTQSITVNQAYANYIAARSNLEIVLSQNESDIKTAELTLALAEIDLRKFKEGDFIQQVQEVQGRLLIAQSDKAMWEERSSWSSRMSKPGRRYVTVAQSQADEARLKSAQVALSKVEEEMRVLKMFTGPRTEKDLTGKVDEARRALARVKTQATNKQVQAETDLDSKKSIYEQEVARAADIRDEIGKCLIVAPQTGMVVYYVPEQARFGSGSQQSTVAQGEPVREGQKLMRIPNLSKMQVNTRVHEAMISRVRGEETQTTGFDQAVRGGMLLGGLSAFDRLARQGGFTAMRDEIGERFKSVMWTKVGDGQPATVRVDAFSGELLPGEVKSVATVASQQDWLSADVKVYQTMVTVKREVPGLKPGMSAEVTIYTDSQRDSVLAIPLQAILGSVDMGKTRRVYVMTPQGPKPRDVVIGLHNEKMAEVESGLKEGDMVVVNPRVLLSDKEKAELGDSGFDVAAKAKGKGKGGKGLDGKGKGKGDGKGDGKGGAPGQWKAKGGMGKPNGE